MINFGMKLIGFYEAKSLRSKINFSRPAVRYRYNLTPYQLIVCSLNNSAGFFDEGVGYGGIKSWFKPPRIFWIIGVGVLLVLFLVGGSV